MMKLGEILNEPKLKVFPRISEIKRTFWLFKFYQYFKKVFSDLSIYSPYYYSTFSSSVSGISTGGNYGYGTIVSFYGTGF